MYEGKLCFSRWKDQYEHYKTNGVQERVDTGNQDAKI
jgi:hypothetical protein